MKIIAILFVLYQIVHKYNNNYFLLFITLYFFSAGIQVNTITFLKQLYLKVSYNVLQKRLKNIAINSAYIIKKEAINLRMLGI